MGKIEIDVKIWDDVLKDFDDKVSFLYDVL